MKVDNNIFNQLNHEQKQAVTHSDGPVLIVAGAGTGKTTVITQRIAYLIEKNKIKPEQILALTFTDKASTEMEERVERLLPIGYVDLWVSTFHSFCERILKDYGLDIGLPTDFKLVDSTSAWLLVRQNLDKFNLDYYRPLGNPAKFIHTLLGHFSRCKDQAVYPEDYLAHSESLKSNLTDLPEDSEVQRIKEVANAYHVYQRLLLENNCLDFGDLINYCFKLFNLRGRILERYRKQFQYILVDEFQDTNWIQYELIKLLAKPKNNLTVCSDDDQAIYRWRGASYNNVLQFRKDFPKAKEVSLIRNYRSSQNILDLAYKFIQANNPNRLEHLDKINKKLVSSKSEPGVIEHLHFKTLEQEASGAANKIIQILQNNKQDSFSDFAILVRANNSANNFSRALERAEIPYYFMASRGLYSQPIILDVISYFKLLDNYHESSAVYRILNLPFLQISADDIIKITQYAYRRTTSLYQALEQASLIIGISREAINKINFILGLVQKHTSLAGQKNVSEVFIAFVKDSGYLKHLASNGQQKNLDLVSRFFDKIKSFETDALDPSLKNFMEQMNLELESGEQGKMAFDPETGPDVVRIMTIHSAKGLEFKHVFLVNLVDKRFPTIERKEPIEIPEPLIKEIMPKGDVHLEEERRLCYVAITRAKKGLFLCSADDYGGARKKKLSRFLLEMGYGNKTAEQNISAKKIKSEPKQKNTEASIPRHFSFSQLAAFSKCPLQYKFAHILKVPIRGKAVFSFGKTMHNVLYEFVKGAVQQKNREQTDLFGSVGNAGSVPTTASESGGRDTAKLNIDDLLKIYEQKWIDDWYESKQQKQEYRSLGKKILKNFYNDFIKNKPQILFINQAPALEQSFNFKLLDNTLIGKIDRIDQLEDGVEIIDYKTGKAKEKISSEEKRQLLIYQMASEQVLGLKPARLTYYYLENGEKISFLGAEKDKQKEKEQIIGQISQIKQSDFKPSPGWQCRTCDFCSICDHASHS